MEVYPEERSEDVAVWPRLQGGAIVADDVYPTEPREGVYPEEHSEDVAAAAGRGERLRLIRAHTFLPPAWRPPKKKRAMRSEREHCTP